MLPHPTLPPLLMVLLLIKMSLNELAICGCIFGYSVEKQYTHEGQQENRQRNVKTFTTRNQ